MKTYNSGNTALIKNNQVTTQVKPSLVMRRIPVQNQQIIPPNPINPFSNPARINPQSNLGLPSIYTNKTSLENFNDLTGNEDVGTQITAAVEKFFGENGADILFGVIGLAIIILSVYQIAKPI